MTRFRIAIAQISPKHGDPEANADLILQARQEAGEVDLVVFSELALSHYRVGDLLNHPTYQAAISTELERLACATSDGGPALLIGTLMPTEHGCMNAAVLLDDGKLQSWRGKHHLPNFDIYDDQRYFLAGDLPGPMICRGLRLGVMICEDMWHSDVSECLAETGAELLVTLSASAFEAKKQDLRLQTMIARVVETGLPHLAVNFLGGCDDVIFDGGSMVIGADRSLRGRLPQFRPGFLMTEWEKTPTGWVCAMSSIAKDLELEQSLYEAAVLGVRDFVGACSNGQVVLGLSGGIDSALCAAIATDALGPNNVLGIRLPAPWSSAGSLTDADDCARALGIELRDIPIGDGLEVVSAMTQSGLGLPKLGDLTTQNLQSRLRGLILMAISNETGRLLLSTGNKSEVAVGYATLYGDMCGAYNPLKDMYKTQVRSLVQWRCHAHSEMLLGPRTAPDGGAVIPSAILDKPPSAELKPGQKDTDSLPPYELLDQILERLIEGEESREALIAAGFEAQTVDHVCSLLFRAEFKRYQSCPGPKLSRRDFGAGRRYSIMNSFRP